MSNKRHKLLQTFDHRLSQERGTLRKVAPRVVALTYPSPYRVGMSSLGFQVLYQQIHAHEGVACERAFLPDDVAAWRAENLGLLTYESRVPVGRCDVVAFSLAYELELPGLLDCLDLAGLPVLAKDRDGSHPLVVVGGPLTFSNPVPAGPFADVIVMGEAEQAIHPLLDLALAPGLSRAALLEKLAAMPGMYVPSIHGERMVPVIAADDACLPAFSAILTPDTELSDMHLVESERGCHRACTFCVMRRSTNGGMRLASVEAILATIPPYATKVGLVGAAVSDHPQLVELVRAIVVERGCQVSLSSLRADRLTPELVELLGRSGNRTLTVASDGASERLRAMMMKRVREPHLIRAAELVRDHGLKRLKVYMMIGVPHEEQADLDEMVRFTQELSKICPIAMGIAPFVAKRNTPLDRQPFAGIPEVERRLLFLQKALGRKVDLRTTSARWAWVEYCLAQGGFAMGLAALQAWKDGASFGAWKRAIRDFGEPVGDAAPPPIPNSRAERLVLEREDRALALGI